MFTKIAEAIQHVCKKLNETDIRNILIAINGEDVI